jgi:hypothetical protein
MKKTLKWQQKIIDEETKLTNTELYESVLSLAQGDEQDGGMSDRCCWEYDYLEKKLRERLATFLSV